MRAVLTVQMDNAAFEDRQGVELARILRRLADRIDCRSLTGTGADDTPVLDYSGNRVGELRIEDE